MQRVGLTSLNEGLGTVRKGEGGIREQDHQQLQGAVPQG